MIVQVEMVCGDSVSSVSSDSLSGNSVNGDV